MDYTYFNTLATLSQCLFSFGSRLCLVTGVIRVDFFFYGKHFINTPQALKSQGSFKPLRAFGKIDASVQTLTQQVSCLKCFNSNRSSPFKKCQRFRIMLQVHYWSQIYTLRNSQRFFFLLLILPLSI